MNTTTIKQNNKSARQVRTRAARERIEAPLIIRCDKALKAEKTKENLQRERENRRQAKKHSLLWSAA